MNAMARCFLLSAVLTLLVGAVGRTEAGTFTLPGTTDPTSKLDLGSFAGGTDLQIQISGTIDLTGGSGYTTNPDGSVVGPVASPYTYANPGATNYPTTFGGDGINHYVGGGANFAGGSFGPAGAQSTDTTDPATIRLGAVIGTFSPNPTRSDWFLIGYGAIVVVPDTTAHLYVAVNDTYYPNNVGAYTGTFTVLSVPEPSSLVLAGIAALGGLGLWARRRPYTTVREGQQPV